MALLLERDGGEIVANTTLTGSQGGGKLTPLEGGGFVVVWNDDSGTGGDASGLAIKAQLFDASGAKMGGEFTVNAVTSLNQSVPSASALPGGGFAVVWMDQSGLDDTSSYGIKARIFAADGTPSGGEFLVNTEISNVQVLPAVATLADGHLIVTWQDGSAIGPDTSSYGVKAQLLDSTGAKVGGEFLVNTTTNGPQTQPQVAALADGDFVISYFSVISGYAYAQLLDSAGNKIGGEQSFIEGTPSQVTSLRVDALGSGYIVSWGESPPSSPGATEVKAQIFDDAGDKVGSILVLNSETAGAQTPVDIQALPDGGFIALWSGPDADGNGDAHAQVFDAAGNKLGTEFIVNATTAGIQLPGSLALLSSGEIAVSWTEGSGPGADMAVQLLKASSAPASEIAISTHTISEIAIQNLALATLSASGGPLNVGYTYEIVSDSTGGAFTIVDGKLYVIDNSLLDHETAPTADITVRATDDNGISFDKALTLDIADAAIEARYSAGPMILAQTTDDFLEFTPPAVAALTTGGFVIVRTTSDSYLLQHVYGQFFDANGQPAGNDFPLDVAAFYPITAVAPAAGGGFAVAFVDAGDPLGSSIHVQLFDSSGAKTGTESRFDADGFFNPSITALTGGGFAVTWDKTDVGAGNSVHGAVLNATGATVGSEFVVNTNADHDQWSSQVAALPGGGFAVVWSDNDNFDPSYSNSIRGQYFDASGAKVGSEFTVVADDPATYGGPSLTVLDDGNIVVGWVERYDDGTDPVIDIPGFQIVDSSGAPVGSAVPVAAVLEGTNDKHLAATADGGFVMTWDTIDLTSANPDDKLSYAQFFDASGAPIGDAFVLEDPGNNGYAPTAATLASGDIVFAWDNSFINSAGYYSSDPYVRILSPATPPTITAGDDYILGNNGAGGDLIDLSAGGSDIARTDAGDQGFYMGAAFSAGDQLDGGAGTQDQVGLQGDYSGGFTLGASSLANIEALVLLPGSDTRFGDVAGNHYSYYLTMDDGNVAAGQELVVNWNTLRVGENVTFNGATESNGHFLTYGGKGNDTVTGGQQDDGFYFGFGNWGAGDNVDGQGGTQDQLGLQGNYSGASAIVFGAGQLSGIEAIVCLPSGDGRFGVPAGSGYSYDLTTNDANVAAGHTLYVNANTLLAAGGSLTSDETLSFNGAAESDGQFIVYSGAGADTLTGGAGDDQIWGGGGADQLRGGLGHDTFGYVATAHSSASAMDQILDFAGGDKIDLSPIDAIAGGGAYDAFSFIGAAAFSHTAGELRAYQSGGWFVEGDTNGDGLADLVIAVTSDHPLTSADFVL